MTAAELQSWQGRHGLSQVEAARQLGTPVQTYRNWLHGRREIPPMTPRLCRYIDLYGPLADEAA